MNQTFTGAVRYTNGGKHVFTVGNVANWQEAIQALKDVPQTVCHIVVVPKSTIPFEMEPQTA